MVGRIVQLGLPGRPAPEWSVSSQLRYEWSLAGLLAAAQLDYSWRDDLANKESLGSDLSVATFDIESYSVAPSPLETKRNSCDQEVRSDSGAVFIVTLVPQ